MNLVYNQLENYQTKIKEEYKTFFVEMFGERFIAENKSKTESFINEKISKLNVILNFGLDIGTVIKDVVNVSDVVYDKDTNQYYFLAKVGRKEKLYSADLMLSRI